MFRSVIAIVAALMLASVSMADLEVPKGETFKLDNGMTVILKENHASPMITSVVFINAGARYETDYNNGVTHFLEHLLFDGTRSRDRIALNETVEMYGGYINAFTRQDLTAYMILMPREFIDIGLDIQSDQLFNSILPEEELPKERKIVIEEIKMNMDDPDFESEVFHRETVYRGTPYSRPVLGYENIISTIPRERILQYYQTYYMPNNMTALVIGDFETPEMLDLMNKYYGKYPAKPMPDFDEVDLSLPAERTVKRAELDVSNTHVQLVIPAPHYTDPDYYAFYLLAEYLGSGDVSPLNKVLTEGDSPLAQSASAWLTTQHDFSLLEISAMTDNPENSDKILAAIDDVLDNKQELLPSSEDLHNILVTLKTQDIYLSEKLHYYGIMIAPMMVATGYEFLETLIPNLEEVPIVDISRVAEEFLVSGSYLATITTPKTEEAEDTVAESEDTYVKEVLPNGLTAVVKSNPDSRVFAMAVIGKNRSAMEPEGKDGITDFVNQMLTEGTSTMSSEEFSKELSSIGANVTVSDNPFIPYDDRYTTPQFAFIKFETIDEFADKGMSLLSSMLTDAAFNEADIERVRRKKIGMLARSSDSPREQCRRAFYESLFPNSAFSKSVPGTQMSLGMITRDDLLQHYRKFYSPENVVLTVCTNEDPAAVMERVEREFGSMQPSPSPQPSPVSPTEPVNVVTASVPMDKEQVYIYLGGPLPGISAEDAPALKVAGAILSDRLALELREKQGLAYSVGASVSFDRDFGWYIAAMGTGRENYDMAKMGILAEIDRLKSGDIEVDELKKAINSIWGSSLTRNLSRTNQAYYMGVYEYLNVGYDYGATWMDKIRSVTAEQVVAAATKYFSTSDYVLATAGLSE
jgi:zinc protease